MKIEDCPGRVVYHLLLEAEEILKAHGPSCAVMLLHRAALEAILKEQGFTAWKMTDKLKPFLKQNTTLAKRTDELLALKTRGDDVAHNGAICEATRTREGAFTVKENAVVLADHKLLAGLRDFLYAHDRDDFLRRFQAWSREQMRARKRGARGTP